MALVQIFTKIKLTYLLKLFYVNIYKLANFEKTKAMLPLSRIKFFSDQGIGSNVFFHICHRLENLEAVEASHQIFKRPQT